jgi:hypothetical protein
MVSKARDCRGFWRASKGRGHGGLPKLFLQRDYAYVAPSNDRRHSSIEWTLDRLVIRTALRISFVYWLNSNKGTKTLTGFFATCREASSPNCARNLPQSG